MKCLVWLVAVWMIAPFSAGQQTTIKRLDGSDITTVEIDQTMGRLMKAAEVTGAEIAIINDGTVVFAKGYGFRDMGKNLPLTAESVISAASISKAAFGYFAMELVDQGLLDLDKPVYQYLPKPLPEYPKYADLANDERYKKITARMLLSHTSGFANWRFFEDERKLKIHFEPGSRYAYSGEGIDLLQLVVETITRHPLEESMREHVFQPLGMNRTSMVWQERFETDFANAYDEYGRSLGPHRWTRADAAGSMQTTAGDVARLVFAVMQGKELKDKTREQITTPQIKIHSKHQFPSLNDETTSGNDAIHLSYGLAWGLYESPYGKAFFKEGHDDGWRNYAVGFPKKRSGIVILTNSSNGEGIFKAVLETLLGDTFTPIEWEGYTPYDKLPPRPPLKQHNRVAVEGKILDSYVGRYGAPPQLVLAIRREADHLSIQENEEPKQQLLPESNTDFYSTASDDSLTFVTDDHGKVTGMTLHVDGKDMPLKRIE
jgi:CubicO group peptidase (beta-lactamase class C family)